MTDLEIVQLAATGLLTRSYVLDDLTVRSDGDGRTVEAYAAVFSRAAEIRDQDGHYNEELDPASFNKTIADNGNRFGVFYNHAMTLHGTPDGTLSVPIGVPLEVRADERGVWTATRYLDNPLADSVLDGIKNRAIRGQSFSGRFVRSTKAKASSRGALPTITRHEVAMREYGPTVFPAYVEAEILGTRSVTALLAELRRVSEDERAELLQVLGLPTPVAEPGRTEGTGSQDDPAAQLDEPAESHSSQRPHINLRAQARKNGGPLA